MVDWDKVSAIVAITAIVLSICRLLAPVWRRLYLRLREMSHRRHLVDVVAWDDLYEGQLNALSTMGALTSPTSDLALITAESDLTARSQLSDLANFFERVWRAKPCPVIRPTYLDPRKDSLGIDADALVAAILLDASHGLGGGNLGDGTLPLGDSFSIRYGEVKGRFQRFEGINGSGPYITGRLSGFPLHESIHPRMRGLTKDDLRAVAAGYPPFYRRRFTANSGVSVAHPVRTMRDIHRGAWLVAIGFSADQPLGLYNSGKTAAYREACDRVLHTLKRLQGEYLGRHHGADAHMLEVAVRGVARMNAHSSGSGLPSVTAGSRLQGCEDGSRHGNRLSATDLVFAMELFADFGEGPLSSRDRARAEPILEEAVKAAVCGVYIWWQYVNNFGSPLPGWMRDERFRECRIWIEEGKAP